MAWIDRIGIIGLGCGRHHSLTPSWLAHACFSSASWLFEPSPPLLDRWALGLVVCTLIFSIAQTEDCFIHSFAPISTDWGSSLFHFRSLLRFKSSIPYACFGFWVIPAGMPSTSRPRRL